MHRDTARDSEESRIVRGRAKSGKLLTVSVERLRMAVYQCYVSADRRRAFPVPLLDSTVSGSNPDSVEFHQIEAPRLENPKRGCCYQYRMSASFLSSTQLYPVRITALQNVATYWFNTSSQARLQKSVPGDTSCYLSQITAHYWCRPQLLVTSTEHGYITATEITDSYFLCVSNLFALPRAFCNDTDSRS